MKKTEGKKKDKSKVKSEIMTRLTAKEKRRVRALISIIEEGNFIRGNLVNMRRVCGNPNCKCARGEKHESLYIHAFKGGKQKMIYIPKNLESTIKYWVERHHKIVELIEDISEINKIKLLTKKAKKITKKKPPKKDNKK